MEKSLPVEISAQEIDAIQLLLAGISNVMHVDQFGDPTKFLVSATGQHRKHSIVKTSHVHSRRFTIDYDRHHSKLVSLVKELHQ